MRRHQRRWGRLLVGAGLLGASLAVPAYAQDTGEMCHTDPLDDVHALNDTLSLDDDAPVDEPRADIIEFCFTSGVETDYAVSLDEPTDPASDDWAFDTLAAWFVLTNDDHTPDFVVVAGATFDPEAPPQAYVVDVRGTTDEVTCVLDFAATDTGVAVNDVPADCLDGAEQVWGEAAMFYNRGDVLAYDVSDVLPHTDPEGTFRDVERLAGHNRTETSVAISRRQFQPGEASTVYLARGDVFADAAVGGVLTDGPILIVPPCGDVPAAVRAEIERLDVDRVTALGGDAAVCDALLAAAAGGRAEERLGGDNRFQTSIRIANAAFPTADRVYLARSDEFIDAVTGGTLTDGPILLVPRCGVAPIVIREAVEAYDPAEVVALGGTSAVCDDTLADAANGRPTARLAGDSRYHTAVLVAQHAFAEPSGTVVYLARADLPVDALAGGVLTDGPILIVPPCGDIDTPAFDALAREISRQAAETLVTLGGEAAICDQTLEQASGF